MPLGEACRKELCFSCTRPGQQGHRCAPGAIVEAARKKLGNGGTHVRLVRDLLLGLEGEAQAAVETVPGMEGDVDGAPVHYATDPLEEVDNALCENGPDMEPTEQEVQEYVTYVVAAEISTPYGTQDFQ